MQDTEVSEPIPETSKIFKLCKQKSDGVCRMKSSIRTDGLGLYPICMHVQAGAGLMSS